MYSKYTLTVEKKMALKKKWRAFPFRTSKDLSRALSLLKKSMKEATEDEVGASTPVVDTVATDPQYQYGRS
jgi:hypothetical protein